MVRRINNWVVYIVLVLMMACLVSCSANEKGPSGNSIGVHTIEHVKLAWRNDYSGTENGYYRFFPWQNGDMYEEESPWIFRANLAYMDIQSRCFVYLCNVPGCMHNNESCTSYIRASGDLSIFPSYDESKIYLLSKGADNGEVYTEDDLGAIIEANPDGSSRKRLYQLRANECFSVDSRVAVSENYIYVTLQVIDKAETGVKKYLYRFSTLGDRYERLLELGIDDYIFAAHDEELIITQCSYDANAIKPGAVIEPVISQFAYNVNTGKTKEISEPGKAYNTEYMGTLYRVVIGETIKGAQVTASTYMDIPISYDIYRYSFETSREEKLGSISLPTEPDGFSTISIYSHYAFATYYEKDSNHERRVVLDFDTGDQKELQLSLLNNPERKIRILYENRDSFVVISNQIDSTITLTDEYGTAHVYDFPDKAVYSLMSKEDFFNDIPEYLTINDLIA